MRECSKWEEMPNTLTAGVTEFMELHVNPSLPSRFLYARCSRFDGGLGTIVRRGVKS